MLRRRGQLYNPMAVDGGTRHPARSGTPRRGRKACRSLGERGAAHDPGLRRPKAAPGLQKSNFLMQQVALDHDFAELGLETLLSGSRIRWAGSSARLLLPPERRHARPSGRQRSRRARGTPSRGRRLAAAAVSPRFYIAATSARPGRHRQGRFLAGNVQLLRSALPHRSSLPRARPLMGCLTQLWRREARLRQGIVGRRPRLRRHCNPCLDVRLEPAYLAKETRIC